MADLIPQKRRELAPPKSAAIFGELDWTAKGCQHGFNETLSPAILHASRDQQRLPSLTRCKHFGDHLGLPALTLLPREIHRRISGDYADSGHSFGPRRIRPVGDGHTRQRKRRVVHKMDRPIVSFNT